jgi:hypothetical protein
MSGRRRPGPRGRRDRGRLLARTARAVARAGSGTGTSTQISAWGQEIHEGVTVGSATFPGLTRPTGTDD